MTTTGTENESRIHEGEWTGWRFWSKTDFVSTGVSKQHYFPEGSDVALCGTEIPEQADVDNCGTRCKRCSNKLNS